MSTNTRAEAFAPASMGNVGIGFDILGLAFENPGDQVIVERRSERGAVMLSIEGDDGVLPLDAAKNTASVAVNAYLKTIDAPHGVGIHLKKDLPLASGLGSSAASAVAAVMATNALFGEPLAREALLPSCLEGEASVSGYHLDNVGPSLLGGITLITGMTLADIHRLPVPTNMHLALVTPNIAVKTTDARAVLPQHILLKTMVSQAGGVARLIDALYRDDLSEVASAMESDVVIEPARAHLMPLLNEVREASKAVGALCVVISGAGPTLCAVCESQIIAKRVSFAMKEVYESARIECVVRTTQVNVDGAHVICVE